MLLSRKTNLRPLLQSQGDLHLTCYLPNPGSARKWPGEIRAAINEAYEWLSPVMDSGNRKRFLAPLDELVVDFERLGRINGNLGLFRNKNSFHLLELPMLGDRHCGIASSFHVKPLLRWLQEDSDFLFVGLARSSAHLYTGSQTTFDLVDSVSFNPSHRFGIDDVRLWLNDWMSVSTDHALPRIFTAGNWTMPPLAGYPATSISLNFEVQEAPRLCGAIRDVLAKEARLLLGAALQEFVAAEGANRAQKNIFKIAKAAAKGQVRKLLITDELKIFGKINEATGGLAIHAFDEDHEDDDLLDDLAQLVLNKGGEVILGRRHQMPSGRPILALMKDQDVYGEKTG